MKVLLVINLLNGKSSTIPTGKLKGFLSTYNCMEFHVQNANLSIHWPEVVVCTSHAVNANTNFAMVVTNLSKWALNVDSPTTVLNWDSIHITPEIAYSTYEIKSQINCKLY